MRSASALERSALGIRFEIETLWRATSKQPLLLQLTTSGALLSGWVWGSFFLFSALLFTSFFSTQHTHTHSHTQNKRNRNHLFKIRFLVTSFINFRFFVYLFEAENFCSPRLRTLASRLLSLFRLFGQDINSHLPVAGVTRQTPLPVVAVVVVVGVICKWVSRTKGLFFASAHSMTHLIDWLSLLWQSVIALCTNTHTHNYAIIRASFEVQSTHPSDTFFISLLLCIFVYSCPTF